MLRVAGRRLRLSSLPWRSPAHDASSSALVATTHFHSVDSSSFHTSSARSSFASPPHAFSLSSFPFLNQIRGLSFDCLASSHEMGLIKDLPCTMAAIKNPTAKISYDDSS